MDAQAFKTRYKTFESVDDTIISTHLEESKTLLSAEHYGKKYTQALFLLTAHELQIEAEGNENEVITSAGIEGGSTSFKNLAKDNYELYYSKTLYGSKFLALKKTVRFVGAVLCE